MAKRTKVNIAMEKTVRVEIHIIATDTQEGLPSQRKRIPCRSDRDKNA
jgi:hypothetical protein